MAVTSPDSTTAIQLGVQDFGAVSGILTAETYADILAAQMRDTDNFYEIGDPVPAELAGRPFVIVSAAMTDYDIHQFLCVGQWDNYMLTIILTGMDDSVLDYTDCFSQF